MHKWLVDHGWITGKTSKTAKVMSYLASFFIFPCPAAAIIERIASSGSREPAGTG